MGCETGNDLNFNWPYMKYFVDFYSVVRICDAGENCTRKTNIVCVLLAPYFSRQVVSSIMICLGASNFTLFAIGCSV